MIMNILKILIMVPDESLLLSSNMSLSYATGLANIGTQLNKLITINELESMF